MSEKEKPKILGNKSEGYKYNYTSLADIVIAGYELPPMRIATLTDANGTPVIIDGAPVEYIEAQRTFGIVHGENGKIESGCEWVRGARVVLPKLPEGAKDNKTMNDAQAYGSAITYARRYTALMIYGIATEDDSKVEVKTKEEAQAQELADMKKELHELYKQAGGNAFENYLKERGGLDFNTYAKIKAELKKRITDKAEAEKEHKA
jgi:hypothetical protein